MERSQMRKADITMYFKKVVKTPYTRNKTNDLRQKELLEEIYLSVLTDLTGAVEVVVHVNL